MRKDPPKDSDEQAFIREASEDMARAVKEDPLILIRGTMTDNASLRQVAKANHRLWVITAIYAILATVATYIGWTRDVEFRYFYINQEGHVYETRGMTYPTANTATVTNFAARVGTMFHTWTHRNYMDNFTELFDYCTTETVERYYDSLGSQGIFATAEQYNQRYESVATGARIQQQRTIDSDGRQEWRVRLSVNEQILGTNRPVTRDYDMVIDVRQVPLSVSPQGLQCVRVDENYSSGGS